LAFYWQQKHLVFGTNYSVKKYWQSLSQFAKSVLKRIFNPKKSQICSKMFTYLLFSAFLMVELLVESFFCKKLNFSAKILNFVS